MFRELTIGQYYPGESVIHRLDPRVKLMGALLFIVSVFLASNIFSILVVTAFLIMIIVKNVFLKLIIYLMKIN